MAFKEDRFGIFRTLFVEQKAMKYDIRSPKIMNFKKHIDRFYSCMCPSANVGCQVQ